jgi:formylglycine-generating enzyme required for sulfatase activity
MKRFIYFISVVTLLSVVLSACGGGGQIPVEGNETPQAEDPALEESADTSGESAVVPVNLAGPPMELGSKFIYVDGAELIAVPGGPFIMGHNFPDNPEREIVVSDIWIYAHKVSNQMYALCVQAGQCSPPEPKNSETYGDYRYINYPVTGVTHAQAGAYCEFVKGRLPTEAEWEKTARGPEGNLFPWGDGSPTCTLANSLFCRNQTTPINQYPDGMSYYEAWDMSGNVREWVADWYSPTYNVENPVADPLGPELGEKRSVRGSSFKDSPAELSLAAHRFSLDPELNLPDLGFRCVIEDPTVFAPWCEMAAFTGDGPYGSEANCTPEIKCNDVSITQSPLCSPNYIPYTIITLDMSNNPPDAWTYDVPGCSQIPGEQTAVKDKYQCSPGAVGPATAEGSCVDTLSCVSICPPHYNKVGDSCVWDGSGTSGTQCLPGSTYDPLTQCCSAAPGTGVDFNLCPAGTYPFNGACVPNPGAVVDSALQDVQFTSCTPPITKTPKPGDDPGGGDTPPGNSCPAPNANSCSYPYVWDGKCGCYCSWGDEEKCSNYTP